MEIGRPMQVPAGAVGEGTPSESSTPRRPRQQIRPPTPTMGLNERGRRSVRTSTAREVPEPGAHPRGDFSSAAGAVRHAVGTRAGLVALHITVVRACSTQTKTSFPE